MDSVRHHITNGGNIWHYIVLSIVLLENDLRKYGMVTQTKWWVLMIEYVSIWFVLIWLYQLIHFGRWTGAGNYDYTGRDNIITVSEHNLISLNIISRTQMMSYMFVLLISNVLCGLIRFLLSSQLMSFQIFIILYSIFVFCCPRKTIDLHSKIFNL